MISLGSHQNIGLHTGARANVVLLTYLLTYLLLNSSLKTLNYFWFQDAITSSAALTPATSPTAKPSPTAAAAAAAPSPSSTSSGTVSSRSPASGHSVKQVMPIYPPNSILATLTTSPPRSTSTSVSSRSSSYASASSTSHAGGSSTSRDVGSYFDRYVKPATSYYDRSSTSKPTTTRSSTSLSRSTWKWCSEYDVILGSDRRWCHISKLSYVTECSSSLNVGEWCLSSNNRFRQLSVIETKHILIYFILFLFSTGLVE